jgi:hypothetical protein
MEKIKIDKETLKAMANRYYLLGKYDVPKEVFLECYETDVEHLITGVLK